MPTTTVPVDVTVEVTDLFASIKLNGSSVWSRWNDRTDNPTDADLADVALAAFAARLSEFLVARPAIVDYDAVPIVDDPGLTSE